MSNATVPVSRYRYRRSTCEIVNWTIDREAMAFVRQFCPSGTKMISRYITRLIYEDRARQEERQRAAAPLAQDARPAEQ